MVNSVCDRATESDSKPGPTKKSGSVNLIQISQVTVLSGERPLATIGLSGGTGGGDVLSPSVDDCRCSKGGAGRGVDGSILAFARPFLFGAGEK